MNAIIRSPSGVENYSSENESHPFGAPQTCPPGARRLVTRMRRDIIPGACATDTSLKSHSARYPGVLLSDDMPVNNSPDSCGAMTFSDEKSWHRNSNWCRNPLSPIFRFQERIVYIISPLHRTNAECRGREKRALMFIKSSTVHKTSIFFFFFFSSNFRSYGVSSRGLSRRVGCSQQSGTQVCRKWRRYCSFIQQT